MDNNEIEHRLWFCPEIRTFSLLLEIGQKLPRLSGSNPSVFNSGVTVTNLKHSGTLPSKSDLL